MKCMQMSSTCLTLCCKGRIISAVEIGSLTGAGICLCLCSSMQATSERCHRTPLSVAEHSCSGPTPACRLCPNTGSLDQQTHSWLHPVPKQSNSVTCRWCQPHAWWLAATTQGSFCTRRCTAHCRTSPAQSTGRIPYSRWQWSAL